MLEMRNKPKIKRLELELKMKGCYVAGLVPRAEFFKTSGWKRLLGCRGNLVTKCFTP